ncbi:MAG TPA: pyridoxamine 5'-phosphate oxidase family protein [Acidovorax sp.]|nr:pyridoxamine 5'-phosphate oxidase family protein [Acidovorax sp.]
MSDVLGPDERDFIARRDSFYLSSISETGWPYIQHRGGPAGFLHVLDDSHLAFGDVRGNRQMLSTGNLVQNPRVALLLMDYARRERLKILGLAKVFDARECPDLAKLLSAPASLPPPERLMTIEVISFDWNCPKYITPRYTAHEVEEHVKALRGRIEELETELRARSAGKQH